MCKRVSVKAEKSDIVDMFGIEHVHHCSINRYNVAPLQQMTIVMNNHLGERILEEARWGLFPFWAKDSVNADSRWLSGKPFFERMLRRQRCIVPCSGFYGWRPEEGRKTPRPMHIVLPGRPLLGIAGFYDSWLNGRGEEVRAFTILTAPSSGAISVWQSDIPIILDEEGAADWLNPAVTDFSTLRKHLEPVDGYMMRAYPVSPLVDNEANESPDCILEVQADFA